MKVEQEAALPHPYIFVQLLNPKPLTIPSPRMVLKTAEGISGIAEESRGLTDL